MLSYLCKLTTNIVLIYDRIFINGQAHMNSYNLIILSLVATIALFVGLGLAFPPIQAEFLSEKLALQYKVDEDSLRQSLTTLLTPMSYKLIAAYSSPPVIIICFILLGIKRGPKRGRKGVRNSR